VSFTRETVITITEIDILKRLKVERECMRLPFFKEARGGPAAHARSPSPAIDFPVQFRPRLIADLRRSHATAHEAMRALLDRCRAGRTDEAIARLRAFAEAFRRAGLAKSVHLYPYLRWALRQDPAAALQLRAIHRGTDVAATQVEATMSAYLEAPWAALQRRRFVHDVATTARTFVQILREEEESIFPLYLPPGQYKFVGSERAQA
jgi:hypothetical protein